ncbi:antibiotic biosynthesis monooxygenase family protein [Rhodopila sp.]|uniref:antibiotic biosynthesis monooxygenase family protein n=1 Tax=Rhodopila sp. TaxID=2480087 RepID=UPI003D14EDFC
MFAVVFEVNPRAERWSDYLGHAAMLRPELLKIDGFIANERYGSRGRPGWLVSLSIWRDEKALVRWRTHALHSKIQGKGRLEIFSDYHLRVGEIVIDTHLEPEALLVQQRFDITQASEAKVVIATEQPLEALNPRAAPMPGLLGSDTFDSLTRPGDGLNLTSWRDLVAAQAGLAAMQGRHRVVRVIRDYGMFVREEAPQYYPPVGSRQTP